MGRFFRGARRVHAWLIHVVVERYHTYIGANVEINHSTYCDTISRALCYACMSATVFMVQKANACAHAFKSSIAIAIKYSGVCSNMTIK